MGVFKYDKHVRVQDTQIHRYTHTHTTHERGGESFTLSRKLTYMINDANIVTHILKLYTIYTKGNSSHTESARGQQFTQVLHLFKDCQSQEENGTQN